MLASHDMSYCHNGRLEWNRLRQCNPLEVFSIPSIQSTQDDRVSLSRGTQNRNGIISHSHRGRRVDESSSRWVRFDLFDWNDFRLPRLLYGSVFARVSEERRHSTTRTLPTTLRWKRLISWWIGKPRWHWR